MTARYPEGAKTSQTTQRVSILELERTTERVTQEVLERKHELKDCIKKIHQMVTERGDELMAELDAIPADISAKIAVRRETLEQLSILKEETEKNLQANGLKKFLQKQLSGIQKEEDSILSEELLFPPVSLRCDMEDMEIALNENFQIRKTHIPYSFLTVPDCVQGRKIDKQDRSPTFHYTRIRHREFARRQFATRQLATRHPLPLARCRLLKRLRTTPDPYLLGFPLATSPSTGGNGSLRDLQL